MKTTRKTTKTTTTLEKTTITTTKTRTTTDTTKVLHHAAVLSNKSVQKELATVKSKDGEQNMEEGLRDTKAKVPMLIPLWAWGLLALLVVACGAFGWQQRAQQAAQREADLQDAERKNRAE